MTLTVEAKADPQEKHELDVNFLFFNNGKLYSGGDDGKIKLWSRDLKLIAEVQAHPCSVYCLTASACTLYSSSNDGTVKSWTLDDLRPKETILSDSEFEFWRIAWADDHLFIADNHGNIRAYKNEKYYGIINIAEPVKDMIIDGDFLYTASMSINVTEIKLEGKNLQGLSRKTISGKAPLIIADSKLAFTNENARDIILHEREIAQRWIAAAQVKGAHELIINALAGTSWDGQINIFSGGWDKLVKKWILKGTELINESYCDVDIVVNAMVVGEGREIYAAGGDGHIVKILCK